ncbi:topless-related protein 2 [Ziziphus jujuba]|uniref:Topless-related protein 2 n=1 Tax=Ziziphus jujuba TaxID=326968 RepID=A0ABM3I593_ZIZJJ|nr:topless-related protein 2 [Ziziphus jujuba]
MSSLSRELVFLILQFLEEEKFKESVHRLEQESGFFFNMKYFEEKALAGEWDEVERYLSGFTKVDDNRYSMKIFFEIRKQKYLEALDRNDRAKAVEILAKDLKIFSTFNEELYKEITQLLTLENFRENEQLSKYGDTKSARSIMLLELKKLIEANPLFRDKLVFPTLKASRLRTLINQSLNWQHQLCKNPRQNPDIKTLFTDHTCSPPNGARAPTPVNLPVAALAKPSNYAPLGAHGGPFQQAAAAPNANALAGWMVNANPSSSVQSAAIAASSLTVQPSQASVLKRPRTPVNALGITDYTGTEHEQLIKRLRSAQSVDEVTYPAPQLHSWSVDELPRTVACTLHQGSTVTSMDFHPSHHTILAVGCANGEMTLWDVGLRERLVSKPFKIWDMATCSGQFQALIVKDSSISVSRVSWSPDGNLIGVAFSKHLIHLYANQGLHDLRQHLEIDAHAGGVNDLAFSHPNKQLCIITCGDDKLIKVWDLAGRKLFSFEGHEAPVYSVCPHQKENIQFIFSTAVDGKIKAWLYDTVGSRVDYDAPGQWCTTMLYSADGSRLFSCGTSKDGDSFLVEWNESEGAIKRSYSGFRKKSAGIVQFDTTKNHFLAVGEDNQIKFWDMDNTNVLASTDAEGGLPSLPRLRFNKEGSLLVVNTSNNGFKVLANADGLRSLRAIEARSYDTSRATNEMKVSSSAVAVNNNLVISKVDFMESSPARPTSIHNEVEPMRKSIEKPRGLDDVSDKTKPWELTEIVDRVQCRVVTMPDGMGPGNKVARLLYTNYGTGVLALGSDGVQKLWKWHRSEQNPNGKATASVVPQHWQPNSGLLMTNDVPDNVEEKFPCIALSKNDSYVMSACGGKVSLFNMMTFKVMTTFMPPPPTSTFLAFHPLDNNIIAIGMEDSTIHIYNVRVDEVKTKLKGHQKRITGLAFSVDLDILVSAGADAQLFFWSSDTWDRKKMIPIQLPSGKAPVGDTRVQFYSDQVRLLVCHETQLALYDAYKTELLQQWVPQDVLSAPLTCASYSLASQLVYATFADGNIGVFDADSLKLRCRIAPSAYLSQSLSNSQTAYPLVVTAHPQEPHQLAVGLTDGAVKVIEPSETEGKWGVTVPVDIGLQNGRTVSSSTAS